jgi:hypothetical protein
MPVLKTKKARLQAEGEPLIVCRPFFDNPAILKNRTRGFASPDYSGFARSESMLDTTIHLISDIFLTFSTKMHPLAKYNPQGRQYRDCPCKEKETDLSQPQQLI